VLLINHNFYWQESLRILIIISHPEKPRSSIGQLSYFSWLGTFGLSNDQLLFFCFLLAWKLVYCTNDQLTCFMAGNPMYPYYQFILYFCCPESLCMYEYSIGHLRFFCCQEILALSCFCWQGDHVF
jgi:hypothetical protein